MANAECTCFVDGCEANAQEGKPHCYNHKRFFELSRLVAEYTENGPPKECVRFSQRETYPTIRVFGPHIRICRMMCFLFHGPCPRKHECCHSCGNRWCINPAHLRWGTRQENMHDRYENGTMSRMLTPEEVREIVGDQRPQTVIAEEYGVTKATISCIQLRKTWSTVTDDVDGIEQRVRHKDQLAEIENRAAIANQEECILWEHQVSNRGYPVVKLKSGAVYVHRHVFSKFVREVGKGKQVRQVCGRKRCCNPNHLETAR